MILHRKLHPHLQLGPKGHQTAGVDHRLALFHETHQKLQTLRKAMEQPNGPRRSWNISLKAFLQVDPPPRLFGMTSSTIARLRALITRSVAGRTWGSSIKPRTTSGSILRLQTMRSLEKSRTLIWERAGGLLNCLGRGTRLWRRAVRLVRSLLVSVSTSTVFSMISH